MYAISVKKVKKYFVQTKALDNVSLEVKEGEIFGFLGPNGAGKTTAIRCMMDFIRADKGEILLFNKNSLYDSVDLKKQIGYIPSEDQLFENWNAQDHIALTESIYGKAKETHDLIKIFNLDLKKRIKDLSTGNRRKVSIVLALIHNPKLLICDEPTSGLDPLFQEKFYEIIKERNKKGMTVFISSHNLTEVEKICSRVAIIKQGKIIATETIEKLENKKIYNLEIVFAQKYILKDFHLSNTEIIYHKDKIIHLIVKKDINKILSILSGYRIENIKINHASLEDIFLEYYKK